MYKFFTKRIEAEEQIVLEIDHIEENLIGSLKNSNRTRWNTLCYMYRSFMQSKNIINIALMESDKMENALKSMEKEMIAEYLQFLESSESATRFLQERKHANLNLVIIY